MELDHAQPPHRDEREPRDEDDVYDERRQRKLDDETAAEMEAKRNGSGVSLEEFKAAPQPLKRVPCHACDHPYAGCICPLCREERLAYTALKKASAA